MARPTGEEACPCLLLFGRGRTCQCGALFIHAWSNYAFLLLHNHPYLLLHGRTIGDTGDTPVYAHTLTWGGGNTLESNQSLRNHHGIPFSQYIFPQGRVFLPAAANKPHYPVIS